jgi:hypothetical protein
MGSYRTDYAKRKAAKASPTSVLDSLPDQVPETLVDKPDLSKPSPEADEDPSDSESFVSAKIAPVKLKIKKPEKSERFKCSLTSGNDLSLSELILVVPHGASEGSQRISISLKNIDYMDVVEKIYEAIGCLEVTRKPLMSYKLGNATQKSTPISLATEDDYEGLLEDVAAVETKLNKTWKNGNRWQYISVNILIPDDVPSCQSIPIHKC